MTPEVHGPVVRRQTDLPSDSESNQGIFVATAAGFYGLGLLALIVPLLKISFRWNGDVINRAVLWAYPKEREFLIYLLACLMIPAISVLAYQVWNRFHRSHREMLNKDAFSHLPLFAWVGTCLTSSDDLWLWLLGAATIHIVMRAAVWVATRRRSGLPHEAGATGEIPHAGWRHDSFSRPSISPAHTELQNRPALSTAWAKIVIAGVACGLSLFPPTTLESTALKWEAIVRSFVGVGLLSLVWWGIASLSARLTSTFVRQQASLLSNAFLPLCLLLVRRFAPVDTSFFRWWQWVVLLLSLGWLGLLLLKHSREFSGSEGGAVGFVRSDKKRDVIFWWVAIPFFLYAVAYTHDTTGKLEFYHEGERIVPAAALDAGAAPYRDVFLWHGLFENGLKGQLAFKLYGMSVSGMRRFERVFEPIGSVALFFLAWACFRSPLGGLVFLLVHLHATVPPNARYTLAYLALALLALWLRRGKNGRFLLVASGALAGLAVFHSLDAGIGALLSVGLILAYSVMLGSHANIGCRFLSTLRHGGFVASGVVLGALAPMIYLVSQSALMSFFRTSGGIVGGLSDRSTYPFFQLLPSLQKMSGVREFLDFMVGKGFLLYIPPLVIVWGLAHLAVRMTLRCMDRSTITFVVPLAGLLVFFRAMIRRPDVDHFTKVIPLGLLVIAMMAWYYWRRLFRPWHGSIRLRTDPVWPLVMLFAAGSIYFLAVRNEIDTGPALGLQEIELYAREEGEGDRPRQLRIARAGPAIWEGRASAKWIESVVGFLDRNLQADETFYDFTNKGLFYFLADRPCPTRYPQTTYSASNATQQEVISDLRITKPRFVLFPSGDHWKYGYDQLIHPMRHPLITRYLYRKYEPFTVLGDVFVLKRKGTKGSGRDKTVEAFLAKEAFAVDFGQLPRLLGVIASPMEVVRSWNAKDLASEWNIGARSQKTQGLDGETFVLRGNSSGTLTSPALGVEPARVDAIIIRLAAEHDGRLSLFFKSQGPTCFGEQGRITFGVKGDGAQRDYRVEVGLLPSWAWRGRVGRIQLRLLDGCGETRLERIDMVSY